jgi:hypothetical protein
MGQNVVYNTTHPTTSSLTHFLTQQHTTLQSITQHSIITHLSLDHTPHSNSPSIIPHTTHYSLTCLRHGTTHHSLTHSLTHSLSLSHSLTQAFPVLPRKVLPSRLLACCRLSRDRDRDCAAAAPVASPLLTSVQPREVVTRLVLVVVVPS